MFESVESVQLADPATLVGALFALTDEQIADMSFEEAVAVVLASQRVMNAVRARQRSATPGSSTTPAGRTPLAPAPGRRPTDAPTPPGRSTATAAKQPDPPEARGHH